MKIPIRYLPKNLSKKDKKKQVSMLLKSRKLRIINQYWENISNMFSYEYDETQDLIKEWAEQRLGLVGISPREVDIIIV